MALGDKKFFGTYRGVVANNKDPDGHRRLKVLIPALNDGNPTDWCWPIEHPSFKTQVPNNGEGVWIKFENGEPTHPIWVGTFGKPTSGKRINIKVMSDSQSLTGITDKIITERTANGTTEIDLVATILAMDTQIKTLQTDLAALHTTLATRTTTGHTHSSAG